MGRASGRRWGSFPTTADVGIWARGATRDQLLEALGLGLFALITDLRTVRRGTHRSVQAGGNDDAQLVVDYLTKLATLPQEDGFLAREIRVKRSGSSGRQIEALLDGELLDPARHPRRVEVKAITYHQLEFDPAARRARVIVDI